MNKQLFLTMVLGTVVATLFSLPAPQEMPDFQDEDEAIIAEIMAEKEAEEAADQEVVVVADKEEATAAPIEQKEAEEKEEVKPSVVEKTFAMIKPDAVAAGNAGDIIKLIELNGFDIVKMEKKQLTKQDAEVFYAVHKGKKFFNDLVNFMTEGPVIALVLEKLDAIRDWRYLMGKTNPAEAHFGTLRRMFAQDITHNAVHGSDSAENAVTEINFFFPGTIKVAPQPIETKEAE